LPELSYAKKISEKLYYGNSHPLTPSLRVIHDINKIATDEYNPRTITGKMHLFVASKQPLGIYPDPALGWGGYAASGLEIHVVPGQHGSIVQEPRVRDLAKALSASLQKAQAQEAQKS
jgi:thioesterase domain-containing protein